MHTTYYKKRILINLIKTKINIILLIQLGMKFKTHFNILLKVTNDLNCQNKNINKCMAKKMKNQKKWNSKKYF